MPLNNWLDKVDIGIATLIASRPWKNALVAMVLAAAASPNLHSVPLLGCFVSELICRIGKGVGKPAQY